MLRSLDEGAEAAPDDPAGEVRPKYRDLKTGETWSGRGHMARWLKVKQDAGEDIETYRGQVAVYG
jgi:DNA-binding protein H-NS